MEFGLFSNGERMNQLAAKTYDEDLFEVVTADKLGFQEAWVSEHIARGGGYARPDTMPAVNLLITKAAALTRQIKMGPAIRPIAYMQPVQVATEAAVADHLTGGRYMSGFGVGGPADDGMTMRGVGGDNSESLRRERMFEAIELILKCWTEPEPFDFNGEFFTGKDIIVEPKPLQKPFMPVGIASSGGQSYALAARKGFLVLMSQYDTAASIRRKSQDFIQAAAEAGLPPSRKPIRVCRYVYVSDSIKKAKNELRASMIPSIEHHKRSFPHHYAHVMPPSGKIEDITFDYLVDVGYSIVGDPDTVYGHLKHFYDESGGFGMLLLLMGKDYGTRQQRARSMKLFMEHVAPRLRELDPDRKQAMEAPF